MGNMTGKIYKIKVELESIGLDKGEIVQQRLGSFYKVQENGEETILSTDAACYLGYLVNKKSTSDFIEEIA